MNIFVLDYNPKIAATYLVDIHCNKMLIESAQMLCTSINLAGGSAPYKSTHKNHPCTIWARQNRSNFLWLFQHAMGIADQFRIRYGKHHKTEDVLYAIQNEFKYFPCGELTDFALAMPDKYRLKDPVQSYRKYYREEKTHIAKWKTEKPWWY